MASITITYRDGKCDEIKAHFIQRVRAVHYPACPETRDEFVVVSTYHPNVSLFLSPENARSLHEQLTDIFTEDDNV